MHEHQSMTDIAISWIRSKKPVDYPIAMEKMQDVATRIRAGESEELVWLLEHPPIFTAGTSAKAEDLFNPHGYPTYDAGRGGQWTYHGPGQRIAYVMLDLAKDHGQIPARDLRAYVHALEGWLIAALETLGVKGERRSDRIGVWVVNPKDGSEAKIAALGVRVTRWVSWHGIALNVRPDVSDFEGIVPCGIKGYGVTSLEQLGIETSMDDVDNALAEAWVKVFGLGITPIPAV